MALKQERDIFLSKSYIPSEVEPYMNKMHLEYFRIELLKKRNSMENELQSLNDEIHHSADSETEIVDRANQDVVMFSNIQRLEMIHKSMKAVDSSLQDIENGKYGFCKQTGKKIGIQRLLLNPEAKLCIEVQEGIEIKNQDEDE